MIIDCSPSPEAKKNDDNIDWLKVAEEMATQPGCENVPGIVEDILNKRGQLIVVEGLPVKAGNFVIGVMIADEEAPFTLESDSGHDHTLQINPKSKIKPEYNPELMLASLSTGFSLEPEGTPNWVRSGMYPSFDAMKTIPAATKLSSGLVVGTDKVNACFEKLATEDRFKPRGDRLIGALFQAARLALEFGAPTPTAPKELRSELSQAIEYCKATQVLARTALGLREYNLNLMSSVRDRLEISRPALSCGGSLRLPTLADVANIGTLLESLFSPDTDIQTAISLEIPKIIEIYESLRKD